MSCTAQGIVKEVYPDGEIRIEIPPSEACCSCGGRMLCGTGSGRSIRIEVDKEYNMGEEITLSIPSSSIMATAFMLYAMGAIVGVLVAAAASAIVNETAAVITFFAVIAIWVPIAA
ncbi:MAG: SoxR reducing system RseC family protein, partial [Deferribacteraceae bacterium]|nr:SoxR reducing system RseC family protein [Deferribacteraceae bacterium]